MLNKIKPNLLIIHYYSRYEIILNVKLIKQFIVIMTFLIGEKNNLRRKLTRYELINNYVCLCIKMLGIIKSDTFEILPMHLAIKVTGIFEIENGISLPKNKTIEYNTDKTISTIKRFQ